MKYLILLTLFLVGCSDDLKIGDCLTLNRDFYYKVLDITYRASGDTEPLVEHEVVDINYPWFSRREVYLSAFNNTTIINCSEFESIKTDTRLKILEEKK